MRQTLSVVLATFNEEKNLPSCLESLKDIADEIIIVDGTSSDKTVEIAKSFGAKVKVTTNKPNFHINKQMAIDMATKDWILQMDADEHVSPELKTEIKEILEKNPKEFNGYWIPRKNWFLGRFLMKGGQYPDYTIRLYRKGKGRLPQKDVHEQAEIDGEVGYLKTALLHYPYASFKHYVKKWDFYNNFYANQIKEEQAKKNLFQKFFYMFMYLLIRPMHWLLTTFIRHKGFVDGWQGFTFSLFSALRFPVSYVKYVGPYKFFAALIILVGAVIRLWNFPNRWGLGGDDGRDAMIALEALRRHEIPLVGSFSSAGPFVFGGLFYCFIMLSYLILPFFVNAPWLMLELVSILTLGLLLYLGNLVKGHKFSLIVGLLTMTSPQLVVRSLSLGQHTFITTFSALALISFVLLWQRKKVLHGLFVGFWVGMALSFHYQAINLLVLLPAVLFVMGLGVKKRITSFLLAIVGFFIPMSPLLYWDSMQSFANIRNLLDYFLIGQYRIFVPNSWKLFITKFVPTLWSFIVGNYFWLGMILAVLSVLVFFYLLLRRKISGVFASLGILLFIFIFINRYYHGERSEGYLLYLVPLVLLLTANIFSFLLDMKNKYIKGLGVLIVGIVLGCNLVSVVNTLTWTSQVAALQKAKNELYAKYPNDNFSIYDYKYKKYDTSMGFSLLIAFDGRQSENGLKVGLNCFGKDCSLDKNYIKNSVLHLNDLTNVDSEDLNPKNRIWINVNQVNAYDDLIGWLSQHNLKSNFDLKKYILEKI